MLKIQHCLNRLGIPRNNVLLVHSAFSLFGKEGFTPQHIVGDLVEYMAPGTILMPTMSWRFVKPSQPIFDELLTPSNTGVLTETLRKDYSSHRSLHPTHSVAGLGSKAGEMLGEHHLDNTPCSVRSPFGKVIEADGWILMLGIGFDCCTIIHHAEEIIAPQLYLKSLSEIQTYICIDRVGCHHKVSINHHLQLKRDYWQFQDQMHRDGVISFTYNGSIVIRAFRARELNERVCKMLIKSPDSIIAKPMQRFRVM